MSVNDSFANMRGALREKSKIKNAKQGKTVRAVLYDNESVERTSYSMIRKNWFNGGLVEPNNVQKKNTFRKIGSFKYDEQKYNLECFKRRTKNSKNNLAKSNIKWSILGNDQNYNSNLPSITKTRTNISGENYSLDNISRDFFKKKQKSQLFCDQPYNEL
jgi:hypothetical protein